MKKIKDRSQLNSAVSHNFRLYHVPNADPEKTKLNQNLTLTKNFGDIVARLENKFIKHKIKPRKDSVQVCEFILTASPEFFLNHPERKQDWINQNIKFIKEEFNENILSVVLHEDETTPHFHILMTPITSDGRLSCKDIYGGSSKLSALQTRYSNSMSPLNLKRGAENSSARHTTVKEFYSLVNTLKNFNANQLDQIAELIQQFDMNNKNFKNFLYSLSSDIDAKLMAKIEHKMKTKSKNRLKKSY